jgi:glyoxylase-like metal-dependent hydrolase (beta-lactamase superfamily II)
VKVHHLNCGTMHAPGSTFVCHVLLVETGNGLVLVDTGYGLADCADPGRIGPLRHLLKPALRADETAALQVEKLGFRRADVQHIVTTHFDFDHIGGLADFPHAQVHVTADEVRGAVTAPSLTERFRYRAGQWAHGPRLVEYTPDGEAWRGFAAARELTDVAPGIVLIPLPGHTRGHASVAVDAGTHWVLHCGDAFYLRGSIDGRTPVPRTVTVSAMLSAVNLRQMRANQQRLAQLHRRNDPDLLMVSAHDPVLLARAQKRQTGTEETA